MTGSAVKNSVHMLPTRLMQCGTPAAVAALLRPSASVRAELLEMRIRRMIAQLLQGRDAGRHRHRVAGQRARLEHRAGRHDLAS